MNDSLKTLNSKLENLKMHKRTRVGKYIFEEMNDNFAKLENRWNQSEISVGITNIKYNWQNISRDDCCIEI